MTASLVLERDRPFNSRDDRATVAAARARARVCVRGAEEARGWPRGRTSRDGAGDRPPRARGGGRLDPCSLCALLLLPALFALSLISCLLVLKRPHEDDDVGEPPSLLPVPRRNAHATRRRRRQRGRRSIRLWDSGTRDTRDDVAHKNLVASQLRVHCQPRPSPRGLALGRQVIGNLGLMAMRCNARVERMWAVTRESVVRYMARDSANNLMMGGDQVGRLIELDRSRSRMERWCTRVLRRSPHAELERLPPRLVRWRASGRSPRDNHSSNHRSRVLSLTPSLVMWRAAAMRHSTPSTSFCTRPHSLARSRCAGACFRPRSVGRPPFGRGGSNRSRPFESSLPLCGASRRRVPVVAARGGWCRAIDGVGPFQSRRDRHCARTRRVAAAAATTSTTLAPPHASQACPLSRVRTLICARAARHHPPPGSRRRRDDGQPHASVLPPTPRIF